MRLHLHRIRTYRKLKTYLIQSFIACVALTALFILEDAVARAAIVAAIGSTTFVLFALPHTLTATPRRVLGGYLICVTIGVLCSYVLGWAQLGSITTPHHYLLDVTAGLAVGLSIFAMVATNTEHPPAVGVTLGLIVQPWGYESILFILVTVPILSGVQALLKPRLKNLI